MDKYHILQSSEESANLDSDDFFERLISNDNDNIKRILCYNKLIGKPCPYGIKCLYAHSICAQKVDVDRKRAYDIITNNDDLSELNLIEDTELYNNLQILTKLCSSCIKKCCPGGYNCKYGSISKKYQICYHDLVYGTCSNNSCSLKHLTKRNLIPYNRQKHDISNIFIKHNLNMENISNDVILLTSDYFKNSNSQINIDTSDESSSEVRKTIQFLNSEKNDSENESIFIE